MELNEITSQLPSHLMQFVVDQPYSHYTSIDQAVWRYVMRKNKAHLSKVAHESYLDGLEKAGIEVDAIPTMYGMNRILQKIGWAAVAVDGFIPPGAFMEFTAYKVLVIAADIRTLEHIEYTPAPDIIHESAGHAPIIANPDFAEYLVNIGKAGAKAFSSKKDFELYEAIRHLSIIKEDPYTTKEEIEEGERNISEISSKMGPPSEMALLRNLHWWTVEYGLIGDLNNYKIYGAGLLSSIGESESCLKPEVKKLKYSINAAHCNYDITKPQPQLFVTPDFNYLNDVLEEFKKSMAYITGGEGGVKKAIESENVATIELENGLQISGIINYYLSDGNKLIYLEGVGDISYSISNRQLDNHGKENHSNGFKLPIGKIRKLLYSGVSIEKISGDIKVGDELVIEYESGFQLKGLLKDTYAKNSKVLMIQLDNCKLELGNRVYLDDKNSHWIALGEKVISAFSGPADADSYHLLIDVPKEKTHKIVYDNDTIRLQELYQQVRDVREGKGNIESLKSVCNELHKEYPNDWLLNLELLELFTKKFKDEKLAEFQLKFLQNFKKAKPEYKKLIEDGLRLIEEQFL